MLYESNDETDTVIVTRTGDESASALPFWLAGVGIGLAGLVVLRRMRKRE